ncbi:MAG: glycogen synthase GlgA [Acuticoccus sp.]
MNVLFVASECAPFVKTGGLADVVGALPKALADAGVTVRVLLPAYPALARLAASGREVFRRDHLFLGTLRVVAAQAEGLDLLLLDAPHLFERPGNPYLEAPGRDHGDNHRRFGALGLVAAALAREGIEGFVPDVLHAHDWQAGLAPAYLALSDGRRVASVTTIHNIAFQGVFGATAMRELDLPVAGFHVDGFEYYSHISFLKAGLMYADRITTVSPTYARELTDPTFGLGFEGIIASRRADLSGILNGVDLGVWNPEHDPHLAATYSAAQPQGRAANRAALEKRFGLSLAPDAPLFCIITRLTRQKGIDLLLDTLPRLLERGAGLVALGSGDGDLEARLGAAAAASPGRVGVEFGYDEPLSHLMQGGADSILIPSRFEPCGLTQLYGLRYGCLPLVARTGGLADTVIDAKRRGARPRRRDRLPVRPRHCRGAGRRARPRHRRLRHTGNLAPDDGKCDAPAGWMG